MKTQNGRNAADWERKKGQATNPAFQLCDDLQTHLHHAIKAVSAQSERLRADRLHAELVKLWEKSDKDPNSKIFGGIKDFKKAYGHVCELAGVTDLHIHDWKHGYVTNMAEAEVEQRIAMRAAGHVNAETHWIYTNIDKRIAKGIADKLNKLHADREKASREEVTDGTGFVS